MNEEKLKQILEKIGRADVPDDITKIAEKASKSFSDTLNILQTQKRRQSKFVIGFRLLAAAAVIAIAFVAGRWSQQQTGVKIPAYASASQAYPIEQKNVEGFWQEKVLAAMQPRPNAQSANLTNQLNAYKQYLKERYND